MPDQKPLTDAEIERLRVILEEDARREWLWGHLRKFASLVFAAVATLAAFRTDIFALLGIGK